MSGRQIGFMPVLSLAVVSTPPGPPLDGPALQVEASARAADRTSALLAPAVNELFAVTLDLASMAASNPDDRVAEGLLEIVERIDGAIRQMREGLLEGSPPQPAPETDRRCPGMLLAAARRGS